MYAWYIFAVVGFLPIILTHGNPQIPSSRCKSPPKHLRECCNIPDIFQEKEFSDCGIPPLEELLRPPECKQSVCIFENYNLTKSGDYIDMEKFARMIDEWSTAHSIWKPAAIKIKETCLTKELPGPPVACEGNEVLSCTLTILFEDCPVWEDSEVCDAVKKNIEQCKDPKGPL